MLPLDEGLSPHAQASAESARPEGGCVPPRRPMIGPIVDTAFRTGLCLLALPAALVLASLWVMLLVLCGAPQAWIDRTYTGFARFALWVAGTRIEVRGLEYVRRGQAYVVVPNHESDWDPVVLMAALKQLRVRAVIKEQASRIPIFGHALLLTGNVRVERTHTPDDIRRIREAMAVRRPDVSMSSTLKVHARGTAGCMRSRRARS